MKKVGLSLLIVMVMIAALFCAVTTASAASSGTCGANLTWTLDDNGTLTISGSGDMKNYSRDYTARAPWISQSNNIKQIVIEENVTSIGKYAFYLCSSATSAVISDSVTVIKEHAFDGCTGLENITIGNGVTTIESYAISNCTGIKSIALPDSVTEIQSYAFIGCSGMKSLTIGENVKKIGSYAFDACTWLTQLNWNAKNADDFSSENYVFRNLGKNAEGINVVFGDSVETIPEHCLCPDRYYTSMGLSKIVSITIGKNVKTIGRSAFQNCNGLVTVTIGEGLTSLNYGVFYGCNKLTYVYYYGTSEDWSKINFNSGNEYLTNAEVHFVKENTCTVTYDYLTNGGYSTTQLTDTKTKGDYADLSVTAQQIGGTFLGWNTDPDATTPLSSYILEGDVTLYAIWDKQAIASGFCGDNLTWLLDRNGTFTLGGSGDMYNYGKTSATTASTPWFLNRADIKELVIGENVTSIGNCGFFECDQIENVIISDSVTKIGYVAFSGCRNLKTITLGKGVKDIAYNAFTSIPKLSDIFVVPGNKYFCSVDGVLFSKDKTTLVRHPQTKGYTTYIIPDGVKTVGECAFMYCENLTGITIPDGVTTLENYAFYGCKCVEYLSIPDTVVFIGEGAGYCANLSRVEYTGTQAQWNAITIEQLYNEPLFNATLRLITTYKFVDMDGTVLKKQTFIPGAVITPPATPANKGEYVFDYWEGYTKGMTATESITFKAVYKYIPYAEVASIESDGIWAQQFSTDVKEYTIYVDENVTSFSVTPVAAAGGRFIINNSYSASGTSVNLPLSSNKNEIKITLRKDGYTDNTYNLTVIRNSKPLLSEVTETETGYEFKITLDKTKTEDFENANVLVVLYDDLNKFAGFGIEAVNASDTTKSVQVDTTDAPASAKIMLWNSLDSIVPLCENSEITMN